MASWCSHLDYCSGMSSGNSSGNSSGISSGTISSIDSSHKKAVIDHNLGSDSLIVSCFDDSTKENVICSFSMENNGVTTTAARNRYLTFHFDNIPSNDIIVNIMTVEGSSVKTPTYPTS